jgi:hypothetical protein
LTASPTVRSVSASASGISKPNSSSQIHDELDEVQTIGAEIIDEAGLLDDVFGRTAEGVDDDLLHA